VPIRTLNQLLMCRLEFQRCLIIDASLTCHRAVIDR